MSLEVRKRVVDYLDNRIACDRDPRRFGKALQKDLYGLWRYRVGDIRIIAHIQDHEFIVLLVDVDKRDKVYKTL